MITKTCPECNTEFSPRTNAVTCSKECARTRKAKQNVVRCRERYATEPEYRRKVCAMSAKYRRIKSSTDCDYVEKERVRNAGRMRDKRSNPDFRVKDIARTAEYLRQRRVTDTAFREQDNARRSAQYQQRRNESVVELLTMLNCGSLGSIGKPCFVYMFSDSFGVLLYVGITNDPKRRLYQHTLHKPWSEKITVVRLAPFRTETEALAAEAFLIKSLRPSHNVQHNGSHFEQVDRPVLENLLTRFVSVDLLPRAEAA